MVSRCDWLLQQIGITQWILRRPGVLRGKVAIKLSPEIRFLIVAHIFPDPHDLLFCDVLRSLRLTPAQTYNLTPDQVEMLPKDTDCNSWRIGVQEPLEVVGVQLYSQTLAELYQNPQAKRALWQQICHYERLLLP